MSETKAQSAKQSVRLKIPAALAGFLGKDCSHEERLRAIRGACDLTAAQRLILLICFVRTGAGALAEEAARALAAFPVKALEGLAVDTTLQPAILAYVATQFATRHQLEGLLLGNPALPDALRPQLEQAMIRRESSQQEEQGEAEEFEDEDNLSKYQQTLHMGVADKIKAALTGDKEWRKLLIGDPNKLVSSAVLKNPRISEGEVYAVARNRSASDELIRIILLNREWLKNYNIKLALVMHPRTPLAKALRFMAVLTEKDLNGLAKSREISRVIANNARRILMNKNKQR